MSHVPGSSWRTVGKHIMMRVLLDIVCGATSCCWRRGVRSKKMDWLPSPLYVMDTTAGYGQPLENADTCSVELIHEFMNNLILNGVPSEKLRADFVEKYPQTFHVLEKNIRRLDPIYDHHVLLTDINDHLPNLLPNQFNLVLADPNRFTDLTAMGDFFGRLNTTSIMFLTCGCNVRGEINGRFGSIKGRPVSERWKSFEFLMKLLQSCELSEYRRSDKSGASLVCAHLLKDNGHWFYLVRLPRKWQEDYCNRIKLELPSGLLMDIAQDGKEAYKMVHLMKKMCFKDGEIKASSSISDLNDLLPFLLEYETFQKTKKSSILL